MPRLCSVDTLERNPRAAVRCVIALPGSYGKCANTTRGATAMLSFEMPWNGNV